MEVETREKFKTVLDTIFWGSKPFQLWTKSQRFEDCLHHQWNDDGGGNGLRNVGLLSKTDMACCPRRFHRESLLTTNTAMHLFMFSVLLCCVNKIGAMKNQSFTLIIDLNSCT